MTAWLEPNRRSLSRPGHVAHPRNYALSEWRQAKRVGKDPEKLKAMFQDCWAISDSQATFAHALKGRGYLLARGDRRGFIAVDHKGEAYAISKWAGHKAKKVRERLADMESLPDKDTARAQAAKIVADRLKELPAHPPPAGEPALLRVDGSEEVGRPADEGQA